MQLTTILLAILPMIFTFTVSEAARGFAAHRSGDPTPKQYGRLTFNPTTHIDPVGTVVLPLASFLLGALTSIPFVFGWAKPMPINARNFKNLRAGIRLTALAAPLANLVMCFLWGLVLAVAMRLPESVREPLGIMAQLGISFNAWIMVLSLLPILPFDGGRIIDTFLPYNASVQFHKIEPYGAWVVLFLLMVGALQVLAPIVHLIYTLVLLAVQGLM